MNGIKWGDAHLLKIQYLPFAPLLVLNWGIYAPILSAPAPVFHGFDVVHEFCHYDRSNHKVFHHHL